MSRLALLLLTLLAIPLALSACAPQPAPIATSAPTEAAPEPSSTPTMEPAEAPLPDDALLSLTATAELNGGPVAHVSLVVHKSLAWDDPKAADLAAAMTSTCDGSLEESVYNEQLFTFTRVDYSAVPVADGGMWTAGPAFDLMPSASIPIAPLGDATDADSADISTPLCLRNKEFPIIGEGALVLGLEGDTDENLAAGNFTRWSNQAYGFVSKQPEVVFTDCKYTVTELGNELGPGIAAWNESIADSMCAVGFTDFIN